MWETWQTRKARTTIPCCCSVYLRFTAVRFKIIYIYTYIWFAAHFFHFSVRFTVYILRFSLFSNDHCSCVHSTVYGTMLGSNSDSCTQFFPICDPRAHTHTHTDLLPYTYYSHTRIHTYIRVCTAIHAFIYLRIRWMSKENSTTQLKNGCVLHSQNEAK